MSAQSVLLPPWQCPSCGQANSNTTAHCTNKRFDETSPRYMAIPPVPPKYGLHNFGEYLKELGLDGVDPPTVVWECPGVLICPVGDRGEPSRAYGHGPRCQAHADVMAVVGGGAP
jgi:hypothetical protein